MNETMNNEFNGDHHCMGRKETCHLSYGPFITQDEVCCGFWMHFMPWKYSGTSRQKNVDPIML
jgi:hypothetical protein